MIMSSWEYTNTGASTTPENEELVRRIFAYIGYATEPEHSLDGSETVFEKPTVYCCKESDYEPATGHFTGAFSGFETQDLINLLNALFPGTVIYEHFTSGSTASDAWDCCDHVYDPGDMTCTVNTDDYYYGGPGHYGESEWKERFEIRPPKAEHVASLIDLSTKDGNGELTTLLLELSEKLAKGLVTCREIPGDTRKIGEHYDVCEDMVDPWTSEVEVGNNEETEED